MSLAGRQLGRYRLLEMLGTGGMSVVYRGLDTALQREVAVKVLHPHLLLQHGEARRRLEREARAVARLHHPNIVEVFDVADASLEDAFLVTELVRGETLRAFAERERCWPPELGALVVHQVASALAHAHQAGVVHRDLKPENVMLREDGVLKLMDFGIARVLDPAERMTQTGALVGSPAYMAPEVIDGQAAGPEADVFALGTLLYWLWTGALPFAAASTSAMLKRILDGLYEDPRGRTAALSDGLAVILSRCLQHKVEDRYPSAAEVEAALAAALSEAGLGEPAAELAAFHLAPAQARARLVERLAERLGQQAEAALGAGRTAVALAKVDQLLGLRPKDAVAHGVLKRALRQRRRRRSTRLLGGALALGLLALLAVGAVRALRGRRTGAQPLEERPALAAASLPAPAAAAPGRPASAASPALLGPERSAAAVAAVEKRSARGESVRVELLVRPYGSVSVDGGPLSRDPLAAHTLQLTPGRHTIRVSCQWCEDSEHAIDVLPGGPQTFALSARLKTAYLSFDFQPRDATVTVAGEQRTSQESLARPFALLSPRAATRFVHQVAYVVSHPGYRDTTGTVEVLPGQSETLSGKLEPQ
ncbi:MAG: protein kinase domain-containing protein [Myxococcaceae bacterium]